jgi:hypothetical protein
MNGFESSFYGFSLSVRATHIVSLPPLHGVFNSMTSSISFGEPKSRLEIELMRNSHRRFVASSFARFIIWERGDSVGNA